MEARVFEAGVFEAVTGRHPELCEDPARAADILRGGGLVAFPTETVYGLGVDATNALSVERLFAVKGRPSNNPLIVHVADARHLKLAADHVPELASRLLDRFAPGPLTVVVPKLNRIIDAVTASLPTVGVRVPDEPLALRMLELAAVPIAAPSANRSGRPSCTTWQSVIEDFGDAIDAILIGQPARIGLESTVVDCLSSPPRVLRPGQITLAQLQTVEPSIVMAGAAIRPEDNSPGRLHPHYRPLASVELFDDPASVVPDRDAAYLALESHTHASGFGWHCRFDSPIEYARRFYESLRQVDRHGLKRVYCQRVPSHGETAALADRLSRAAE